jgi:hypothetical protein
LAHLAGAGSTRRALQARHYLEQHVQADGGVAAYHPMDAAPAAGAPASASYAGWFQSHACVTGGAAGVPGFEAASQNYLRQVQRADGSWQAYWWRDHAFATALAAEALAGGAEAEKAARWAAGCLTARGCVVYPERPGGSPFATACCLRVLLAAPERGWFQTAACRAFSWLLASQWPDGSWAPSARVRKVPPDTLQPDPEPPGVECVLDARRAFTTATVLFSLQQAGQRLVENPP